MVWKIKLPFSDISSLFKMPLKLICVSFFMGILAPLSWANSLLEQRMQFQDIYSNLEKYDLATVKTLQASLADYPIAYYLTLAKLRQLLPKLQATEVQAFIEKNHDSPALPPFQREWLLQLAKNQQWQTFLAFYQPVIAQKHQTLQCHAFTARLSTHTQLETLATDALSQWTAPLNPACQPVIDYLATQKIIDNALRWQRIQLLLKANENKAAQSLAAALPATQQNEFKIWQAIASKPLDNLKNFNGADSEHLREAIIYGIKAIADKDATTANSLWMTFKARYAFSAEQQNATAREIALEAFWQKLPEASEWLLNLNPMVYDEQVSRVILQVLLNERKWELLAAFIQKLAPEEQQKEVWQYWRARALVAQGQTNQATPIFEKLAMQRSYYGFLAADRVLKTYQFNEIPTNSTPEQKNALLQRYAGITRAKELFLVNLMPEGRREWTALLEQLPAEDLKILATLASEWGWYNRAIVTLGKAQAFDDLAIRFPTPYYDTVFANAELQQIETAWVYAIIRQESAFQEDAVSSANAIGLMQILPTTAKEIVKRNKLTLVVDETLLKDPQVSIQLGTLYLRQLRATLKQNIILATAAYNAGASRANQWVNEFGCNDPEVFIELIPFKQTRDYVQTVMQYIAIFEYRLLGNTDAVKRIPVTAIREDCAVNTAR